MRLEHAGAALKAKLTVDLGGTVADLTVTADDLTGWPSGSVGPFYAVINRGLANQEKILFGNRTGNVLTVYSNGLTIGRAADGTVIQSHLANSVIEHIWTATEADAANAHIEATSTVHGVTGDLASDTDMQAALTDIATLTAEKANLAGATFTGEVDVVSATAAGSTSVRQITISTADPSGGADGDVWLKYVP